MTRDYAASVEAVAEATVRLAQSHGISTAEATEYVEAAIAAFRDEGDTGVSDWHPDHPDRVAARRERDKRPATPVETQPDAYRLPDGRVVFVDNADRTRLLPSGEPTSLREDTDTATPLALVPVAGDDSGQP